MKQFLLDVRARTKDGDAIAIAAPLHRAPLGAGAYDYLFERAIYLLAGRRIVPLVSEDDKPQPQNVLLANYVAGFHAAPAIDGFEVVWRGRDGVLLRRVR